MPASLSVIIPVFERRTELDRCLAALREQQAAPSFEVIVVDDGSKTEVRPTDTHGAKKFFPRVIRQRHSGVACARNAGIAAATGTTLVFVDSDVIVGRDLLRVIADATLQYPEDVAFQIQLSSADRRVSCRMENARLVAIQRTLTRPDGSIGYVNTSAFAVRRSYTSQFENFFDARVCRGEDTLVLARLTRDGFLPRYLPSATADHRPPGTLVRYIVRHLKIGYQTTAAREQLVMSPGIILSWSGRLRMLRYLMENSGGGITGWVVSALAIVAYVFEICGRVVGHWWPGRL